MKPVTLLDCTLRDGGYVNNWEFGHSTTTCIFERLVQSGVDIIEVGFLDDRQPFDINRTIQPTTACYDAIFAGCRKKNAQVFAMIDYGTCAIDNIAPCADSFLDGIRVIFKKPKMRPAVEYARRLIEKGYKVSLQLVSITSYEDKDILELVELINEIKPYGVSMVDTYGLMHKEQMSHYFHLLDHNMAPDVILGYHSHNNFQLAYANEIEMLKRDTDRALLVDGTVYGIGKSAGNAPLELLAVHLNEKYHKEYDIEQILEIIDVNIMRIYQEHYWGYSLKFFLAASNNCHPSYIDYLLKKHTLSVKAISEIVKGIEPDYKLNYNQTHIEELYRLYQDKTVLGNEAVQRLAAALQGRRILALGPGASLKEYRDKITAYIEENDPVVFSVNCIPQEYRLDYVFVGNSKRYSTLFQSFRQLGSDSKIVVTSNITAVDKPFDFVFDYDSLRDEDPTIADNAFIMLLKALKMVGMDSIVLAGFDGFSDSSDKNYYDEYLNLSADFHQLQQVNDAVKRSVAAFRREMNITFLTKTLYED